MNQLNNRKKDFTLRNYYNANVHVDRTDEGFETKLSIAMGAHCVEIIIIDGLTSSYYRLKVVDSYGKNVTSEFYTEYPPGIEHIPCDDMIHAMKLTDTIVNRCFSTYQR